MTTCSVEECDAPARARGWCVMHYRRWARHGDPTVKVSERAASPGYSTVHWRLRSRLGHATSHDCVDCGARAKQWSYSGSCVDELSESGMRYCVHSEHYSPRCLECHFVHDDKGLSFTPGHGEHHHSVKLSDQDVRDIRSRYVAGDVTQRELAEDYGVTTGYVRDIIHKRDRINVNQEE